MPLGAALHAAYALRAGIDVDLPSTSCYGTDLEAALKAGEIGQAEIDQAVTHVLVTKFRLGLFDAPDIDRAAASAAFDAPPHRELARQAARESVVILKNNGVLPLSNQVHSIALIGPTTDEWRNMIGDYAYPSHVEAMAEMKEDHVFDMPIPADLGDVSASLSVPTVRAALQAECKDRIHITCVQGCDTASDRADGIPEAVDAARGAEVSIIVLGDKAGLTKECTSGESRDMADLRLPGRQEQLLEAILGTGKPVVVVLVSGRPYALASFHDRIDALLCAWLPGQAGGEAVAEVLVGTTNPCGKLPISFPRSVGQVPVYNYHTPSGGRSHWTGNYVDQPAAPLYPFGHGLSYTSFEYSDCAVEPVETAGDRPVAISFSVCNTGSRAGTEVAQLYVGYRPLGSVIARPVRQLKGFARVALGPGQKASVRLTLHPEALAFFDEDMKLRLYPGEVAVMIGSSSEDVRCRDAFHIIGSGPREIPASGRKIFSIADVSYG